MKRRDFLKVAAATAGTGALLAADIRPASADTDIKTIPPEGVGLLYDSTVCVGCKACVAACKQANDMPPDFTSEDQLWDEPIDLSAKTLNIIQLYRSGNGTEKDRDSENGYAFIKRQCMHCADPGCVSACPVNAMTKDPVSGVVQYNQKLCIGCRYCMVACPYTIPKFEWDKALPRIYKCELCRHRTKDGKIPACAESCPTGATIAGKTADLLNEAKNRLTLQAGAEYAYPLNTPANPNLLAKTVAQYDSKIYGQTEGGGTQCLILSAIPAEKLGLPKMPEKSYASLSENIQHTLYKGMIAPGVLFIGLLAAAYRNTRKEEKHHE